MFKELSEALTVSELTPIFKELLIPLTAGAVVAVIEGYNTMDNCDGILKYNNDIDNDSSFSEDNQDSEDDRLVEYLYCNFENTLSISKTVVSVMAIGIIGQVGSELISDHLDVGFN
jgi:hypothetical protein